MFNGLQWVSTISSSTGDCHNRSLSAANESVWRDEGKTYSYDPSGKAVRANTLPALGAPPTASEVLEVAESSACPISPSVCSVVLAGAFQFKSEPRALTTIDDTYNIADVKYSVGAVVRVVWNRWTDVQCNFITRGLEVSCRKTTLPGHTATPAFLAVPKRRVQRVVLRQRLRRADEVGGRVVQVASDQVFSTFSEPVVSLGVRSRRGLLRLALGYVSASEESTSTPLWAPRLCGSGPSFCQVLS